MSIFSKIKSPKLASAWDFEARGADSIIWKLLISPNGILAGEERDTEKKTGSLFAVDVASGKTLWRGAEIDEPWWFNSEVATRENIYIHKFKKPDMPEALGIVALDIATGKLRWEQPGVAMLFELDGKLFAQREGFGGKEFFSLGSTSGEIIEAFGSGNEEILARRALIRDEDHHSVYSAPVTPDDELFEPIKNVLEGALAVNDLRGAIDFAQIGKYIIFSYHERITTNPDAALKGLLRNDLKVLDTDKGEIVHAITLNRETPYPQPENFFIHRGILIYVTEKRTVTGISLL
jgi:hypothetical protein